MAYTVDGDIAPLKRFVTWLMIQCARDGDDAHATRSDGTRGGTPEACGVTDRVDFVTGTFGKAQGGAGGAFTATRKERQNIYAIVLAYLFSNSLDTAVTGTSLFVINYLKSHPEIRELAGEHQTLP